MAEVSTEKSKAAPVAADKWIAIINNEERLRLLNLQGATSSVSKTLAPGPQIALIPGVNFVDRRQWETWKKQNEDRTVDGESIEGQASTLLKGEVPADPHKTRRADRAGKAYLVEGPGIADIKTPLAKLDDRTARAVVAEILDEPTLKRLIPIETRGGIVDALRKKLLEHENANRPAA